jgi:hypothetical protein
MSQQPPRHRKTSKSPTAYAGLTTCLRCDAAFISWDKRQNRLCQSCRDALEAEPSDEPSYPLLAPKRRLRNADEG